MDKLLASPLIEGNIPVRAYLGTLCPDVFGIGASYQNAVYTFSVARGHERRAYAFELLDHLQNINYVYPQLEENALCDAVTLGHTEKVDACCEALTRRISQQGVSLRTEWGIRISVLNNLKTAMDQANRNTDEYDARLRAYLHLDSADILSIRDAFLAVVRSACEFCAALRAAEPVNTEPLAVVLEMQRYIDENFGSYDMSLSAVAEHVSLSASYASKLFKDELGLSVKTYIDAKRMDTAKHMLEHTDYSAEKIAVSLGFMNVSNFYTKFKKTFGITTQQYRAMCKK